MSGVISPTPPVPAPEIAWRCRTDRRSPRRRNTHTHTYTVVPGNEAFIKRPGGGHDERDRLSSATGYSPVARPCAPRKPKSRDRRLRGRARASGGTGLLRCAKTPERTPPHRHLRRRRLLARNVRRAIIAARAPARPIDPKRLSPRIPTRARYVRKPYRLSRVARIRRHKSPEGTKPLLRRILLPSPSHTHTRRRIFRDLNTSGRKLTASPPPAFKYTRARTPNTVAGDVFGVFFRFSPPRFRARLNNQHTRYVFARNSRPRKRTSLREFQSQRQKRNTPTHTHTHVRDTGAL